MKVLKELRDSKIAHSDKKVIEISKTTWKKIDELSEYVTEYLDIIEHAYLATSRSIDSDAKRHSNSLRKILLALEN